MRDRRDPTRNRPSIRIDKRFEICETLIRAGKDGG